MKIVEASSQNTRLMSKLLTGSIPRPVALITSMNEDQTVNVAPFSYFNMVSYDPPVMVVSILRQKDGVVKDTSANLQAGRPAIIHLVTETLAESANLSSVPYPYGQSEADYAGIKWREDITESAPIIQGADFAMSVDLFNHQVIEQDNLAHADVFLLKVNRLYLEESIIDPDKQYIEYSKLKPILRLAGNDYGKLGDIFQENRPN